MNDIMHIIFNIKSISLIDSYGCSIVVVYIHMLMLSNATNSKRMEN